MRAQHCCCYCFIWFIYSHLQSLFMHYVWKCLICVVCFRCSTTFICSHPSWYYTAAADVIGGCVVVAVDVYSGTACCHCVVARGIPS